MCKKGGFRCASHLSEKIEKLEAVEDRSVDQDAELRDAKYAYYGTPTGQKNLDKKIQRAEDKEDSDLASRLHKVKTISSMMRQEESRQHKERADALAEKEAKQEEKKEQEAVSNVLPADFNMDTAEPADFDTQAQETAMELDKKQAEFGRFFVADLRKKYDKRVYVRENGISKSVWEKEDKEVVQALKEDDSPEGKELRAKYNEHVKGMRDHQKTLETLDDKYKERGSWNRAYLAASGDNGHVHKSKDCSTCNKGETPTKFDWKTSYSGADEKTIVKDAGYRACTVCYPSAPVGDRNTLPTKMYSQEEIEKNEARVEREKKATEKKAAAISNAPTIDGKPLVVKVGNFPETYKTERTAFTAYNENSLDYMIDKAETDPQYKTNPGFVEEKRQENFQIMRAIAEKRDISIKELQEEMRPKVEAKIKKHNRDKKKPSQITLINNLEHREGPDVKYVADSYDLSDEKYNTSPRNW